MVLHPWQVHREAVLLPFDIHLRFPGELPELPLNAVFGLAPFSPDVETILKSKRYRASYAADARRRARTKLFSGGIGSSTSLCVFDWERCNTQRIEDYDLPGDSFLSLDVINREGLLRRGHRAVIGKMVPRNADRPQVIAPSVLGLSEAASARFASIDLMVIDLQRRRSRRLRDSVHAILRARQGRAGTLVFISSPSDFLWFSLGEYGHELFVSTQPVMDLECNVREVNPDRMLVEREFDYASEVAREKGGRLWSIGQGAWWAIQQSVADEHVREVERFTAAVETEQLNDRATADAFRPLVLLLKEHSTRSARNSRLENTLELVSEARGTSGINIVTRNWQAALAVQEALATRLEISAAELSELGVQVGHPYARFEKAADVGVTVGYFGRDCLDVLLYAGVRSAILILDPIEVRAAYFDWIRVKNTFNPYAAITQVADRFLTQLETVLRGPGTTAGVVVDLLMPGNEHSSEALRPPSPGLVRLLLSDGTDLEVPENSRFDTIGPMGRWMKTVRAAELKAGDEVVILVRSQHSALSDELLDRLDDEALRPLAEKRAEWLTLVDAVAGSRRMPIKRIASSMKENGTPTDQATIRTWVPAPKNPQPAVPMSEARFVSFAHSIGITLPDEYLKDSYRSIARLRSAHRILGRALARVLRLAQVDRLDVATLKRVERSWGFDPRVLLAGATIQIVEEVIGAEAE